MLAEFAVFDGYVTLPEFLWTLMGFTWLIFSIRNLREDYRDLHALKHLHRNGYLRRIAIATLHTEWMRFGVFVIEILTGITSMASPPPNESQPVTLVQIYVTVAFFIMNILVGGMSYIAHRTRKELDQEEARHERSN